MRDRRSLAIDGSDNDCGLGKGGVDCLLVLVLVLVVA